MRPFRYCDVYLGISFLLLHLGQQEKADHYESMGLRLLDRTVDAQSVTNFLPILARETVFYSKLNNLKKAHNFAVIAF